MWYNILQATICLIFKSNVNDKHVLTKLYEVIKKYKEASGRLLAVTLLILSDSTNYCWHGNFWISQKSLHPGVDQLEAGCQLTAARQQAANGKLSIFSLLPVNLMRTGWGLATGLQSVCSHWKLDNFYVMKIRKEHYSNIKSASATA